MIEAEALMADGLRHGFFTRRGGVSDGLYDSLNIGLGSQDDRARVLENRARVAEKLAVPRDCLALPYQHHSPDAVVVEAAWRPGAAPKADAVVSRAAGLAVGVSTADCGPVLFAEPQARIIAAAHAGWRGALGGVLASAVAAMEQLGASRRRIVAVLGPTISQPCYEVGPELRAAFLERDPANHRFFELGADDRFQFDLPGYIVDRLAAEGLGHVAQVARCTYSEEDQFFSYRRATHRGEPDYGRLVSAIALEP